MKLSTLALLLSMVLALFVVAHRAMAQDTVVEWDPIEQAPLAHEAIADGIIAASVGMLVGLVGTRRRQYVRLDAARRIVT